MQKSSIIDINSETERAHVAKCNLLRHQGGIFSVYTAIQEMRDERGERLIMHSPNIVNMCIDSYDGEKQCGRLYHQYTGHTVLFSTLFEALDRMERLYDELQFPQASTDIRRFQEDEETGENRKRCVGRPGITETFDRVIVHRGEDATFIIRVQYRQYSSWQGEVTWMDGKRRRPFRSVLELARLIDKAMNVSGKEEPESGKRFSAVQAGKQEGKWSRDGSAFRGI